MSSHPTKKTINFELESAHPSKFVRNDRKVMNETKLYAKNKRGAWGVIHD
jgi:hypothetical protein